MGRTQRAGKRSRWLREARAYACVRHPNIVPLHDAGEAGPWLYLVLEYVPGGSLKHQLETPYAPTDAARLLETIARAVAAVHSENLVHLDLKPSNILLDDGPESRGNRRLRGSVILASLTAGAIRIQLAGREPVSPARNAFVIAPSRSQVIETRSDPRLTSIGWRAAVYVLTGRPPFSAASVVETLEQVRNQEPVPPRRLVPQVPRDLETIGSSASRSILRAATLRPKPWPTTFAAGLIGAPFCAAGVAHRESLALESPGRQSHRSRQRSFWWCLSVSSLLYRSGGVPKAKPFAQERASVRRQTVW